jgi:hypothetical protein
MIHETRLHFSARALGSVDMASPTRISTHSDNKNVVAQTHTVSRSKRAELLGVDSKFHGCTIWFTGVALSGGGGWFLCPRGCVV